MAHTFWLRGFRHLVVAGLRLAAAGHPQTPQTCPGITPSCAPGVQALRTLVGRLLQELQEALGDAEEATQLLMSQQCVHCLLGHA